MGRGLWLGAIVVVTTTVAVACGDPYDEARQSSSSGGSTSSSSGAAATSARLELPVPIVDFGTVVCGTAPQGHSFEVKNTGGARLEWTAAFSDNTSAHFSILGATTGSIEPNQNGFIVVSALTTLADDSPGMTREAQLTLTTNDPDQPELDIAVKMTSGGGALEILPDSISFGESPVGVAALDVPIALRNSGNLPISIDIEHPKDSQYELSWTGSTQDATATIALEPNAVVPALVGRFTPKAKVQSTTEALIKVTGPTCGTFPTVLYFKGAGAESAAAVQPALVDFGYVACGTAGAAKTITILNGGVASFTYNAALGKGAASQFTVSPATGTVDGGKSVAVSIVPKAIPTTAGIGLNLFGDVVTITTTAPGDKAHPIQLRMSPLGSIFTYDRPALQFGNVTTGAGNGKTIPLKITNSGNATGVLALDPVGAQAYTITPPQASVGGGSTASVNVKCNPGTVGNKNGYIKATTASRLCKPLPPNVDLLCNATN